MARNKKLSKKFDQRVELFLSDPDSPILKDHALTGDKIGKRAFAITGDVRVVYQLIDEETVRFYDVGSHPQVY